MATSLPASSRQTWPGTRVGAASEQSVVAGVHLPSSPFHPLPPQVPALLPALPQQPVSEEGDATELGCWPVRSLWRLSPSTESWWLQTTGTYNLTVLETSKVEVSAGLMLLVALAILGPWAQPSPLPPCARGLPAPLCLCPCSSRRDSRP